jgi:glycosyltransferase involved in cell wall biosynthesis
MTAARGAWLAFLDSDDEWHPSYLKRQIEHVRGDQIAMQMTNCRLVREDGSYDNYFRMNGIDNTSADIVERPFTFVLEHWGFQIGSIIFRHEAVEAGAIRFNEGLRLSEDLDFISRVSLQGRLSIVREELVYQFRRLETADHLSKALTKDPFKAIETDIGVYEGFRALNLNLTELRTLNRKLSGKIRAQGNLLRRSGKIKEARKCYFRAMSVDLSFRSVGKCASSLLRGTA